MMNPLRKFPLWPSLSGGLVLGLFGVALVRWWCQQLPLSASPAGCALLQQGDDGPICVVLDQSEVRVLVRTAAEASVSVDRRSRAGEPPRGGPERLLTVPSTSGPLHISAMDKAWLRWRKQRILVQSLADRFQDQPWVYQARRLWESNHPDEAMEALKGHDDATGEAGVHRRYLLAVIESERPDSAQAGRMLATVADEARRMGLWSLEADVALRLSMLHLKRDHRPQDAERWLDRVAGLLDRVPDMSCWWRYQQAKVRQARGDLHGALSFLVQGERDAARFGDSVAQADLYMAQAGILQELGRTQEADEAFDKAASDEKLDPCRRGSILSSQGWHRILARQTMRLEDPPWKRLAPAPPLKKALLLFSQRCQDMIWARANALTNLAHAAVVEAQTAVDPLTAYAEADSHLQQARQVLPTKNRQERIHMEWAELEGEIALGKGSKQPAHAAFSEMLQMASRNNTYEATWKALLGLARAAATEEEALAFYRQAEAYLDHRALDLPLGTGRVSFLGRFERGTALYLDLLAERDPARAMEVARHARVRGLLALAQASRLDALTMEKRAQFEKSMARYRGLHQEMDRLFADNATAPESERVQDLEQRRERLGRELSDVIDEKLRELGALGEPRQGAFRAPAPGEVLLLCFPRPRGGARCFARDEAGVQHVALPELTREALAGALLPALRDRLRAATRLTVLAYGATRRVPFHLLPDPLTKAPLWERLDVVYGLDLPAAAAPRTERAALLLCDTSADAPGACAATEQADGALKGAGWRTRLQLPKVILGGAQAAPRLGREALLRELAQVRLFHYIGHMKGMGLRSALPLEDEAGLLTADILTLPRAPERVLLFACNSGQDGEETGGLEGLGLAQAFLLRGAAWAVAPVQDVDVALSDRLVRAMYQQGDLTGDAPAPVKLLREARRAVLAQGADPAANLDAFRVFVP